MNKKLYISLLIVLVGNCVVADDYVRAIGRTLNGNGPVVPEPNLAPDQAISFNDAKSIKSDLRKTLKNISKVSKKNLSPIKAKVASLKDLVEKSQVAQGKALKRTVN